MNRAAHGKRLAALLVIAALLLAGAVLYFLHENGLLGNRETGAYAPLTQYGTLLPAESDGKVFFPTRDADGAIAYAPAEAMQGVGGTPYLLTAAGEIALDSDFLTRAREEFGTVSYTPRLFSTADDCYLLIARTPEADAVTGVIFRVKEQFYLADMAHELSDELLVSLASALAGLGIA